MSPPLTIGAVARHFGLPAWKIRRLYETGKLPEPVRLGAYRVFYADDLPKIEVALLEVGYLPTEGSHVA
jgi:DNA-binding transcriptional MerR regulator